MTATAILQIFTIALLAAILYVQQRNRYFVDIERVADLLTANLLADYKRDLWVLDADGVKSYARYKYMQMVTEFGFPSAAVDRVVTLVYTAVSVAQGGQDERERVGEGNAFYE